MRRLVNIAISAVLAVAGLAAAQVGAVNTARTGNALDMNTRVGSGGSNTGGGNGYLPIDNQLYVNGQMKGLGNLQAPIPYKPPDQLQLNLPSASLSNFNRQSVSAADVLGGKTYTPTPYFDKAKTALNAGSIAAGVNAPGTNVPKSTAIDASIVQKLKLAETSQYQKLQPTQPGQLLSAPLELPTVGYTPPPALTAVTSFYPGRATAEANNSEPAGQLFGIARIRDRQQLGDELLDFARRTEAIGKPIKAGIEAPRVNEANLPALAGEANVPASLGLRPPSGAYVPGQDNEDVYYDILKRLRERRERASAPVRAVDGATAEPNYPTFRNLVDLSADNSIVIHRLNGVGSDAMNRTLAEADRLLKEGKYYEAVGQYETALVYNADNPLPRVGLGLAYFGAGESMSAAINLRKALVSFPPLMETRIDVAGMMSVRDFKEQLAALDRQLSVFRYDKPDPLLPFLACMMHLNVGDMQEAKRYAGIITAAAADDPLLQAYAVYASSGRTPQSQPATGPADAPVGVPAAAPAAETQPALGQRR